MMFRSAMLALLLVGCAAQPPLDPAGDESTCDLRVEFASIGTGIDHAVLEKVDALLVDDKGIAEITRERWGREGEITLCVDTLSDTDTARLFDRVKALFPSITEKPLRVETRAGERFEAPLALP